MKASLFNLTLVVIFGCCAGNLCGTKSFAGQNDPVSNQREIAQADNSDSGGDSSNGEYSGEEDVFRRVLKTRCRPGYVRRKAFRGDGICVAPETRRQVIADNRREASRRQPGAYGPDTCRQGFVWREASPTDHVCVTPQTRSQTAYDNSHSFEHSEPVR